MYNKNANYHKNVQWAYYNFTNTFNSYLKTQISIKAKQKMTYYVSEHFKYWTQINEYWVNKNVCLNMVYSGLGALDFCETFQGNFIFVSEFITEVWWEKVTEEINFFWFVLSEVSGLGLT